MKKLFNVLWMILSIILFNPLNATANEASNPQSKATERINDDNETATPSLKKNSAGGLIDLTRGRHAILDSVPPSRLSNVENAERKRLRNYPEQAPTIPHDIRGYQIDLNLNQCLFCHSRKNTVFSGAPMVSTTHFIDRDGQVRAFVSPRRYHCTQCHVVQLQTKPVVKNTFIDIDTLLDQPQE